MLVPLGVPALGGLGEAPGTSILFKDSPSPGHSNVSPAGRP